MKKKKIRLISFVILMIAIFALNTVYAFACLCEPLSPQKRVKTMKKAADAIFIGTVKEVFSENPEFGGGLINKVILTVKKSWKSAEIKEYTIYMSGGCRVWFEKGKSYLVYAKSDKENKLTTDMCVGTRDISMAEKDLKFLGKPVWVNTD